MAKELDGSRIQLFNLLQFLHSICLQLFSQPNRSNTQNVIGVECLTMKRFCLSWFVKYTFRSFVSFSPQISVVYHFYTRCFDKLGHQGKKYKNCFFFKLYSLLKNELCVFLRRVQIILLILPLLSSVVKPVQSQVSNLTFNTFQKVTTFNRNRQ